MEMASLGARVVLQVPQQIEDSICFIAHIAICAFVVRLTAGKARLWTTSGHELLASICKQMDTQGPHANHFDNFHRHVSQARVSMLSSSSCKQILA